MSSGPDIGLTTTVPVEAILAAGLRPVDLNNLFMSRADRDALVETAHRAGFPQGACAWLKGIYGTVLEEGSPRRVVGVVRGDCSGTEVLLEALELTGVEVVPLSFPYPASRADLEREISRFCDRLGVTMRQARAVASELVPARRLLAELDRLAWSEDRVKGLDAHLWLVSASDFRGDPEAFTDELGSFVEEAGRADPLGERAGLPFAREVRLGYLGVPPITTDIFTAAEEMGARFVFHEVQRQFSMPEPEADLVDMYLAYTYPYTVAGRSADINRQARLRSLDGLVHYVQSFCHRNMESVVFNRTLELPVLTLECDCPGELGAAAMSRLESFIQVLGENM
ncbi:MAG: 2-hydroxyacyl-CoA dehydratase [Actinomycetota bacterium]